MALSTRSRTGQLADRFTDAILRHLRMLTDPESMLGWFIVTLWSVLAGIDGGVVAMLILVGIGWFVHGVAVETGNHVMLWLTTAMLLILIVVASEVTFDGLPPVLLAAAGATALVHNELVRLNYARRRDASIDRSVYHGAGLALGLAAGVAMVGVALTQVLSEAAPRPWLWMPVAAGGLLVVGYALTLIPIRGATEASRERWEPGNRIPPQPLRQEDLDRS
ncbi:MAG: hypothetical protein AAF547_05855 [Actinomycetota bacterium]